MIRAQFSEVIVTTDATYRDQENGLAGAGVVIDSVGGARLFRGAFALKNVHDSGRAEEAALLVGFRRAVELGAEVVHLHSDAEGALNGKALGSAIKQAWKAQRIVDVRRRKVLRSEVAECHALAAYAVRRQRLAGVPTSGDGWRAVLYHATEMLAAEEAAA